MGAFKVEGGVEYLRRVAITDPKTFCALLGKLVPVKVEGEDNLPVLKVMVDRPPEETRESNGLLEEPGNWEPSTLMVTAAEVANERGKARWCQELGAAGGGKNAGKGN